MRGIILAVFLSLGGIGLLTTIPSASATSLAPLTMDQVTDASDLVVRGTVRSTWTGLNEANHVVTRSLVEITRVYKDPSHSYEIGDVVIVDALGGRFGGNVYEVESSARYSVEEDVVLFLSNIYHTRAGEPNAIFSTVGMALGKYTIRQNPQDGTLMPVQYTVSYEKPYDARFIPAPPVPERVEFGSFEQQILDRVSRGWDGQPIPGADPAHLRTINNLQPGVK